MKIILAGCTGFIGKTLLKTLQKEGHDITLLSRKKLIASAKTNYVIWDGVHLDGWEKEMNGADAVINLAGAGIADKRWTPSRKKEIFKLSALKVFAVAYERWSLTRGFKYSDLARKLLVFWKTGY